MSRLVLPDSSWYISTIRSGQDPLRELAKLAISRDIAICGMIKAEVGCGLRSEALLERYDAAWEKMFYIEESRDRWDETMRMAWSLQRKGITLPIQDVHIACCASHAGAVILTYDQHFQLIPGIDATDRVF